MAKYRSVADMFRQRVAETPDLESFSYREGAGFKALTWRETGERVRAIACGLLSLGLSDEDRVSILCGTRVEWLLADIGINCAGGATTTIYPSSTADDCQFILENSGSVFCVAENQGQLDKLRSVRAQLPDLKKVILIDGDAGGDDWVMTLGDLEALGEQYDADNPKAYDATIDRITPERLATLIYTSGTTGRPKGVELIHDCWLYVSEALMEVNIMSTEDKQFLWLPLSHSFGKMLEVIVIAIGIPTAVDGEIPKIVDNLAVVKPTFMAAAPRIFEKVYNKIVNGAKTAGGLKWAIFKWATDVGKQASKEMQAGRTPGGMLGFKYSIADKLVFSKVRNVFGGRLRFFISGSAPLNRDIAEFFHAAGVLILEGYGLTESSAASFVNLPDSNKFGTVGKPLPGTEVKIAEDGEILFKSRGVMRGYYRLPDVTEETLDGRWLHTGDIGEVDADGHLKITDRKKDLIKTSGGKYVAPQALEGGFKAICPYVGNIVVHGNARNYCSALIAMDPEGIQAWAEQNGLSGKSFEQLSKEPKVIELFQGYIDQLNAGLARFETIKKFYLVPTDFTVETGELTPSLKVKRKAVESKYKDVLDGFYAESMAAV
jgi:long-chain acyl-CoA synthetase